MSGGADRRAPAGPADRGVAALELILLAPVILMLIALVIAAGRTSIAQEAVDAAARDAARQASIAPNEAAAHQAAVSSAIAALRADGLDCRPRVFLPGLAGAFGSPVGKAAPVRAEVTCVVRLSDLAVPGVPGSLRLSARFTSPLDPYRSRHLASASLPLRVTAGSGVTAGGTVRMPGRQSYAGTRVRR